MIRCVVIFLLLVCETAYAIAPPHPSIIHNIKKSGKLVALKRRQVVPHNQKASLAPSYATKKLVKTGTSRIVVIPVEFSDVKFNKTNDEVKSQIRSILFDTSSSGSSLRKYYEEVSNGKFLPTEGYIADVVTSSQTLAYYGSDGSTIDDKNTEIWNLVIEAVNAADTQVNFALYDNDGADGSPNTADDDKYVDHIFIFHAGTAQEATSIPTDIWSHRWSIQDNDNYTGFVKDNVYISSYIMMSLGSPLGIIVHEFGHDLGFYDLYDTDYSSSGIGNWGLMSGGCWLGNGITRDGSKPAWPVAWHLKLSGWLTPTDITASAGAKSLADIHSGYTAYIIGLDNKGNGNHLEYFLLSNRQKPSSGYDSEIPGSGMMIWHVDENILTKYTDPNQYNANEIHPLVRLIQSDAAEELDRGSNQGDSTDPFYSRSFDYSSKPRSFSYDKSYSAILQNISASASPMTFTHVLKYSMGVMQNPADEKEILVSVRPTFHLSVDTLSVYVYESGVTTEVKTRAYKTSTDFHTVYSGSYQLKGSYGSIRIKVSGYDDSSNKRSASKSVTGTGYIEFQTAPVADTEFAIGSSESVFYARFSPGAVYGKEIMLSVPAEQENSGELISLSDSWSLSSAMLLSPADIEFRGDYPAKAAVYMKENGNWNYLGAVRDSGVLRASAQKTGTYAVFADYTAPQISIDAENGEIVAKDAGSGLSQLVLSYDSRTETVNISAEKQYSYDMAGVNSVEAMDMTGNYSVMRVSRAPVSVNSVRAYPNPCYDVVSIAYKLSIAADHITLKIYDANSELLYTSRVYSAINGTIDWNLQNDQGEEVASGVYFYKLTAVSGDDENSVKGKIAVVR